MDATAQPVRLLVHGLGRVGKLTVERCFSRDDVSCVGVIVSDPERRGRDVGALIGVDPLGIRAMSSEEAASIDADAVIYCGIGTPREVVEAIRPHLAAGRDVVTVTGLVHPPTAIGASESAELGTYAEEHGARLVGTGWNPGFLLDVLPVTWGAAIPDIRFIRAQRHCNIAHWGAYLLEELGIGGLPEDFDPDRLAVQLPLKESAALIVDGLGLEVTAFEQSIHPLISDGSRFDAGRAIDPGRVAGFGYDVTASSGANPVVSLTWTGMYGSATRQSNGAETEDFADLEIHGSIQIATRVTGTALTESYPATAERALATVVAIRQLPPGLYRPDQLGTGRPSTAKDLALDRK